MGQFERNFRTGNLMYPLIQFHLKFYDLKLLTNSQAWQEKLK